MVLWVVGVEKCTFANWTRPYKIPCQCLNSVVQSDRNSSKTDTFVGLQLMNHTFKPSFVKIITFARHKYEPGVIACLSKSVNNFQTAPIWYNYVHPFFLYLGKSGYSSSTDLISPQSTATAINSASPKLDQSINE